jgi:hypothetical protein
VNGGVLAVRINKAVGVDPKSYGPAAGICFIGFSILEVPRALQRFRAWMARMMLTRGRVRGVCLLGAPVSFPMRCSRGAGKGGFFPGAIL